MNKLIARLSPSGALTSRLSVGKLTTPPALQNKTVQPSVQSQTVTFDEPYDGLCEVTVEGVTSAIDANITPENIVKDVEILGVKGTAEPPMELSFNTGYYLCAMREDFIPIAIPALKSPDRMDYCFNFCRTVTKIDLSPVDLSKCTQWLGTFSSCSALEELIGVDWTVATSFTNTFSSVRTLRRLVPVKGSTIGGKSTTSSMIVDISTCAAFTEEALMETIDMLGVNTTGKTRGFKINRGVYESLSQECLDTFAAKNYTLQSSTSYSLRDPGEEDTGEEVIEEEVIE